MSRSSIILNFAENLAGNMEQEKKIAVLFDMDGVVLDTETQYSIFWNKTGRETLGIENFDSLIKGSTGAQIGEMYYKGREEEFAGIIERNNEWESQMTYDYFPGVVEFIGDLRRNGVKPALVTSSDEKKMIYVYNAHPEMKTMFDEILTAEYFTRSKPDPECFLLAMKMLGVAPENVYVFEDSFHGLTAGMASGATVIGMSTTNPRESIEDKAHHILDGFTGLSYEKLLTFSKNR